MAKISSQKVGALRTALFLQYVGGFILVLIAGQDIPRLWQFPTATYITLAIGAINAVAAFSLFKGLEIGQISIISPIVSCHPALSTVLAVVLLNETISQARFAGILAILIGIILVSVQRRHPRKLDRTRIAAGVGYAMVAFLTLGFMFFALKFVVDDLGALLPVLLVRVMSAIVLSAVVVLNPKVRSRGRISSYFVLIAVIGIVDTLGNVTYNLGILEGAVSVVSTISGLFSVVTILLAFIVLKERLVAHQAVGLLVILVGVSIIGYVT